MDEFEQLVCDLKAIRTQLPTRVETYLWVRVLWSANASPLLRAVAVKKLEQMPESWWYDA